MWIEQVNMNIESQKLVRKKCRLGRKYFDYTMVKEAFVCICNDFLQAVQQNQECSWYGEVLQFLPKYFLEITLKKQVFGFR